MNAARKNNFLVGANTIEYRMKILLLSIFVAQSDLIKYQNSKCMLFAVKEQLAGTLGSCDCTWYGGVRQQDYKRGLANLFYHVMAFLFFSANCLIELMSLQEKLVKFC